MEILKIENLTFSYPEAGAPSLSGIELSVEGGEFLVLCGPTGSGKSTLLKLLKREIAPLGEVSGNIFFKNRKTTELSKTEAASKIGFVMQNPEHQTVTDRVWHELAFGLENLGLPQSVIARRVAEMASYFGIEDWFEQETARLSGGQRQLLNLASVMAMAPEILILDEPTAQLDPIAASNFIQTLKKLNADFGLTVIITEHRLEELIPLCDRLAILENGTVTHWGAPQQVMAAIAHNPTLISAMPAAARLFAELEEKGTFPLTVREGRSFIQDRFKNTVAALPKSPYSHSEKTALEFDNVYFRYDRNYPDILKGLDLKIHENEIFCILGGNGSGKTTALSAAAGILKPYSGKIKVFGKKLGDYKNQALYRQCLALLPQDPTTLFLKNTVAGEIAEIEADSLDFLPFSLEGLFNTHPYDLSGGEQQLLALTKVLAQRPKLLLADEPTKGLDSVKKRQIADIFKRLKDLGITVVTVTHDVEFAAQVADRCSLFFGGKAIATAEPTEFFGGNRFYTTAACRMSSGYFENAVTVEQLTELCRINREADRG